MGIPGIYKEIGAGARVAFLRLAIDCLEKRGRPLRLAIDISIWQFQVQLGRGGSNPAIRTLYYRLVRLLGMPVQPVFVFDGLNKPLFKRNKRSAGPGDMVATSMAKRMIRMFGFYVHDAPGEAEAECALLQQRGVVDAVLSEDVDTLMFGCTRTLRNWSAATTTSSGKGSSTATVTHVTMYETKAAAAESIAPESVLKTDETGLDREGMVLVALMSGGDYNTEGVPGCGIKIACEAAKAGFGRTLCRIKRSDKEGLAQWRVNLQHELRTNESKFFRTLHRKLVIPEDFPDLEVLRYYTHPVVSPADVVERVRADLDVATKIRPTAEMLQRSEYMLPKPIDVLALRDFVAETFDWTNRAGAIKFIRNIAPVLMVRMLLLKWSSDSGKEEADEDIDSDTDAFDRDILPPLVDGISRQRAHPSTDETPEVRVSYTPVTVVGLDLERELDDPAGTTFGRDGLALNSDDEFDEPAATLAPTMNPGYTAGTLPVASCRKLTTAASYDPTLQDMIWVPRTIVHLGAPDALNEWDKKQQKKTAASAAKAAATATRKPKATSKAVSSDMPLGSLDRFVSVTKNTGSSSLASTQVASTQAPSTALKVLHMPAFKPTRPDLLHAFDSDDEFDFPSGRQTSGDYDLPEFSARTTKKSVSASQPVASKAQAARKKGSNPWAMAGSQNVPRVTKNTGSSTSTQKRDFVRPATPPAATQPAPNVISLLSSSPFVASAYESVQVPTSQILQIPSSSPPSAVCFSSLALSPSPGKKAAPAASQSRSTLAGALGKSSQTALKAKPKPKAKPKAKAVAIASSSQASPQKQASIHDFFSSPSKAPSAILLSDDEPTPVARRKAPARPTTMPADEDPFLSSSPMPAVFATRFGESPPQKAMQVTDTTNMTDIDDDITPTSPTKKQTTVRETTKTTTTTKRRRYVPRKSAAGFFREEVVDDMSSEYDSPSPERARRGWQESEVAVVDLTGEGL